MLRETPPRERLERALRLSERARSLTMSDVRRQHPGATEHQIAVAFVRRVYGDKLADRLAEQLSGKLAKVDVFCVSEESYQAEALRRAVRLELERGDPFSEVAVAAAGRFAALAGPT